MANYPDVPEGMYRWWQVEMPDSGRITTVVENSKLYVCCDAPTEPPPPPDPPEPHSGISILVDEENKLKVEWIWDRENNLVRIIKATVCTEIGT